MTMPSDLPQIRVNDRFMRDVSAETIFALAQKNMPPTLFIHGQSLVRVTSETNSLEYLTVSSLRGIAERAANFVAVKPPTGNQSTEAVPSSVHYYVLNDILTRPVRELPFPRLTLLTQIPVFSNTGILVQTNGFDPTTGIYLNLDSLGEIDSTMPLEAAKRLLFDELLGDFVFSYPESARAHLLALFLQPFVRQMIRGATPMYLIEASVRGAGKGLLGEIFSQISTGQHMPITPFALERAELEKRITALLSAGRQIIAFDNVKRLGGSVLDAALTSQSWQGRILGQSKSINIPNCATWLATANNVELLDDTPRRIIPIRLEPRIERPEDRTDFRHPYLREWVRLNRTQLINALLSLVAHWIQAGQPSGQKRLGSFEEWSAVIGGILESAGVGGFLENREYLFSDSQLDYLEWNVLLEHIYEQYPDQFIGAREILRIARECKILTEFYSNRSELGSTQRIGKSMIAMRDKVFGNYQLKCTLNSHTKSHEYAAIVNHPPQTPQQ